MNPNEMVPLPITKPDLRRISRIISSQATGWQGVGADRVYSSTGQTGIVTARRADAHNPQSYSIDVITDEGIQLGVDFSAPDYPLDKPAHIAVFREEAAGQLAMTFGNEAKQIFWAIQQAVICGLPRTEQMQQA